MNWQIVIGVVLIGVGTLFTLVGGQRFSKKDSDAIDNKVQQVLTKIDEVKGATAPAQQQQLRAIKEEFADWAAEFQRDRVTKQLKLSQSKLDAQAKAIERTLPVRRLFSHALEVLRESLDAYSAHTGAKISHELPAVPDDIFEQHGGGDWRGTVQFSDDLSWRLHIGRTSDGTMILSIVAQSLLVDPRRDESNDDRLSIFADLESPVNKEGWSTLPSGPNFTTAPGLNQDTRALTDREALTAVIKSLVETQLLLTYPP